MKYLLAVIFLFSISILSKESTPKKVIEREIEIIRVKEENPKTIDSKSKDVLEEKIPTNSKDIKENEKTEAQVTQPTQQEIRNRRKIPRLKQLKFPK